MSILQRLPGRSEKGDWWVQTVAHQNRLEAILADPTLTPADKGARTAEEYISRYGEGTWGVPWCRDTMRNQTVIGLEL